MLLVVCLVFGCFRLVGSFFVWLLCCFRLFVVFLFLRCLGLVFGMCVFLVVVGSFWLLFVVLVCCMRLWCSFLFLVCRSLCWLWGCMGLGSWVRVGIVLFVVGLGRLFLLW